MISGSPLCPKAYTICHLQHLQAGHQCLGQRLMSWWSHCDPLKSEATFRNVSDNKLTIHHLNALLICVIKMCPSIFSNICLRVSCQITQHCFQVVIFVLNHSLQVSHNLWILRLTVKKLFQRMFNPLNIWEYCMLYLILHVLYTNIDQNKLHGPMHYKTGQWTCFVYSVVITWLSNTPINDFSVWSMFVDTTSNHVTCCYVYKQTGVSLWQILHS